MDKEAEKCSLDLFRKCIPYFEVLADENRQKLVLLLAEGHQVLNVGDITEKVSLSRPAVSHHLKILLRAGMVNYTKKGTQNYYFLTIGSMVKVLKDFVTTVEKTCTKNT
ncbi:ArsR family transcriptional regulator [Thiospirochaeta perfilievii]|uniref:ArsR family transcriptional regulator n=1 Tax=Thiospirochaeta perfilievii TaxID=252967 RepID=A0A5C1Q912_9SPIO|nr:metalloregulator ArsR/SmtB family transcription factor [Thiospirochaeta perfilievii]QEN03927.1 ArsR family transcriptional regulator [Thiospirochaeta perfilievii]